MKLILAATDVLPAVQKPSVHRKLAMKAAICKENQSHSRNRPWNLLYRPHGAKHIGCKT